MTSYRNRVDRTMDRLEKDFGYLILKGETCCGGCAGGFICKKYGIPDVPDGAKVLVYNEQSNFDTEGDLIGPVFLQWADTMEDAEFIVSELRADGLNVHMPEDRDETIRIDLDPGDHYSRGRQYKDAEYDDDDYDDGNNDDEFEDEEPLDLEDLGDEIPTTDDEDEYGVYGQSFEL